MGFIGCSKGVLRFGSVVRPLRDFLGLKACGLKDEATSTYVCVVLTFWPSGSRVI